LGIHRFERSWADITLGLPDQYNPMIPANSWAAAIFFREMCLPATHHCHTRIADLSEYGILKLADSHMSPKEVNKMTVQFSTNSIDQKCLAVPLAEIRSEYANSQR
jgi:hypothetical protein